jgi:hypothetical protein
MWINSLSKKALKGMSQKWVIAVCMSIATTHESGNNLYNTTYQIVY